MELTVGDRPVEVEVVGDGPPLVMVHSLLTDAAAFDKVVPTLRLRSTVYQVSLPGFGLTAVLDEPTIEDLADFLASVMGELDLRAESAVMGNGLGGFAAVALAIRHGDRFGKLIAANCGARFSKERVGAFGAMSELVEKGGMEAVVEVAVERIFPSAYLERHPEAVEERRQVLSKVDPRAFAAACRALAAMDLSADLGRIKNPTLVVAGADDQTTPMQMAEELTEGIDGAVQVVLADCGHCPQLQQPEALLNALEAFLYE